MDTWEPTWPGRSAGSGSLGQRISLLRTERGWTQQQLADRLGISRVAVSHLETELNTPSERTVAILAGLFRMEPHDLVDATSYPLAKSDRLPLVVTRWTEVEHQLAMLERDLWWLDRLVSAGQEPPVAMLEGIFGQWDATLSKLATTTLDAAGRVEVEVARTVVAKRRAECR